jgi:hypothetical protein
VQFERIYHKPSSSIPRKTSSATFESYKVHSTFQWTVTGRWLLQPRLYDRRATQNQVSSTSCTSEFLCVCNNLSNKVMQNSEINRRTIYWSLLYCYNCLLLVERMTQAQFQWCHNTHMMIYIHSQFRLQDDSTTREQSVELRTIRR